MSLDFLGHVNFGQEDDAPQGFDFLEMHTQNSQPFASQAYDSSQATQDDGRETNDGDDDDDGPNDDEFIEDSIPEHACSYCGYADPASVLRCNIGSCRKWFCNGRGCTSGAHIVQHLIRSKHKELSLHPSGPLGETVLECFVCGCKNIFLLGFVPSKTDSVVILLCRDPCLVSVETDWDASTWLPLLEDRQLLPWLVKIPTKDEASRTRQISANQIGKLEDMWKTRPNGTVDDLTRSDAKGEADPVCFFYEDAYHYQSVFTPLIQLEAEYDQTVKAQQAKDNITITWSTGISSKTIGTLVFPREDSDTRLLIGDEIRIAHPTVPNSVMGMVVRICITPQSTDEITIEIKGGPIVAKDVTTGFTVELVWKATPFDRMKQAMRVFAADETSASGYLYHRLLGHNVETPSMNVEVKKEINAPGLPELNHSQASAVKGALQKPLSLIQGPPGTGKTVTSATLVYHMCTIHQSQVLVTAPSNVAVDHLAERIHLTGLKVVRMCARSRESVSTTIDFLTLHMQVNQMAKHSPTWSDLHKLKQLRDELGQFSATDERKYLTLLRAVEQDILANADVICTTCVGAGDNRLSSFRFKYVLIDESTQACEPETLIPLVLGSRQVVLVGDHCQLGPVIACKEALKAGLGRSLFERLVLLGVRPHRLAIQYRMHPCVSEFPSNAFYEGTLQNGVTHEDRIREEHPFPWPNVMKPMFFYNSIGQEEFSGSGTSYLNRTEASLVEKCVTHLLQSGVTPDNIGVITPYEGQRAYVVNFLQRNGTLPAELYKRLEVSSVDAFQGREKEYIILSCVRSNDHQGIGFLNDARRLNVALTRAQFGLIVIGNARVLSRDVLWHTLVSHYKTHGLVVEGPLTGLRTVNIQLQKPREPRGTMGPGGLNAIGASPGMFQASYTGTDDTQARAVSANVPYHPSMTPAAQTQAFVRAMQSAHPPQAQDGFTQGDFHPTQGTTPASSQS